MSNASYQFLLKVMRQQGSKNNSESLYCCEAQSSETIKYKEILLDEEDLIFLNEKISFVTGDILILYKISSAKFLVLGKAVT